MKPVSASRARNFAADLTIGVLVVFSINIYGWSKSAFAGPTQPAMEKYAFSMSAPPLLCKFRGKDVPESDRTELLGETSWKDQRKVIHYSSDCTSLTFLNCVNTITTNYTLSRYKHWEVSNIPEHVTSLANPPVKTITYVKGYSRTERQSIEKSIGMSLTAGGSILGVTLSRTARRDLKITDDKTMQWKEEYTEQTVTAFNINTTYVTWSLIDTLHLAKLTHNDIRYSNGAAYKTVDVPDDEFFDVVTRVYDDSCPDHDSEIVKNLAQGREIKTIK